MAASTTFVLSGDPAAARAVVDGVVAERGYTGELTPNGTVKVSRGSLPKTLLLGALAGKNFHLTYLLDYGTDAAGNTTATLHRELGGSALKGGAIGASKAAEEYQAFVDAIGHAASQSGAYISHSTV
ncbi:MAG: hypothetical protein HY996_02925 [Micrococcales bacterium]|nr:hypothetical protein [Micrococcales bacterium]